jgi:ATP-binding cassette subfamily B protein
MTLTKKSSGLNYLKALYPFLKPYKKEFILAAISLILAACSTLVVPLSFRQIIDMGFVSPSNGDYAQINRTFLILLLIAVVVAVTTALRFYVVSWLGERITSDVRQQVYTHVISQSPEFFEETQSGEVLSRLNTDTVLIQTLIGTSVSMFVRNCLLFTGGLVMMFFTSAHLSVLIFAMLLLIVIPIMIMGRKVRKLSRNSQDKIADASGLAGEKLNAITTIQSFTNEVAESSLFKSYVEEAFQTAKKRFRARALLTFVAIVFGFCSIIAVLWLGAYAVLDNQLSSGELTQFILYSVIVAGAIAGLAEVLGDTQRAIGASERLLELLKLNSHIKNPDKPLFLDQIPQNGVSLRFDDINFHYPSNPQNVLNNISLSIEPGELIAIVGRSGAGKSTLFQLLQRFYDPQSGVIKVNGVNIHQLNLNQLRQIIGIVPQDIVIFSDNALENIRYGKLDATDAEVFEAARIAVADEFILNLPQGYQTFLGDRGIRLSGGQRQRIGIARTLLKNPALLLLDEATSALDSESERLIQIAIEKATQNRTTLVIAHRLATVKKANRIVVFDQGRIVEIGTHDELTQQGGIYSTLAELQFSD